MLYLHDSAAESAGALAAARAMLRNASQADAVEAAAAPQAADAVPDAADAQQLCRIYMGMARSTEADITDELSTVAQEQFVQARKADASVQQDTLMNWVTLARLVAASYGVTQVTKEHWDQMMAMEAQRAARVAM